MNESGEEQPPSFRLSLVFWAGVLVFALGSGPLLLTILLAALGLTSDPNPNPVGFGILAFFTFWPSIALIVCGVVASIYRHRSARKRFCDRY